MQFKKNKQTFTSPGIGKVELYSRERKFYLELTFIERKIIVRCQGSVIGKRNNSCLLPTDFAESIVFHLMSDQTILTF